MEQRPVNAFGRPQTSSADLGAIADFVHPVQFEDIWSHSRARTSEQRLALAVLERAILDLQKYRYARRRRQQRIYRETYEWVTMDDYTWPFSFLNVCTLLNLSPEGLRRGLLSDAAYYFEKAA
jgi:hypothetical protein